MSITVWFNLVLHIYTNIYSLPVSQRETLLFTHSSSIHILAILDSQVSNLGMMRWWTCFGWKWRATIRMSMYRFLTNNWHPSKSTHRSILVLAPSTNSEGFVQGTQCCLMLWLLGSVEVYIKRAVGAKHDCQQKFTDKQGEKKKSTAPAGPKEELFGLFRRLSSS